jgi:hypothetical protein
MATWEIDNGNERVGPLEEEHVLRMIAEGLPEAVLVRPAGAEAWGALRSHGPFAAALERRSPAPPSGPASPAPAPAAAPSGVPARSLLRGLPLWVLVPVATALICGLLVVISWFGDREQAEAKCNASLADATVHLQRGDLDLAEKTLKGATPKCKIEHADRVGELQHTLVRKILDGDTKAKSDAKEAAAARERSAVENFPGEEEAIRAAIKGALSALSRNGLEKAAPSVKTARVKLDEFKGTSVEKTEAWRRLDTKTIELEGLVKPYVDKVNAAITAAKAQIAAEDARDRAAGYLETKDDFLASQDLGKLQKAIAYRDANDKEGFDLLVQNDPDLIRTRPHVRVIPFEYGGRAGIYAHVRVKGTLVELWIKKDGLTTF